MKKCRKNRFRKAVSVLLSAVLVIGMVLGAMPAEICASGEGHTHDTYTEWTKTDSLPTEAGNYYLTEDVTLLEKWEVPRGTTNLCLNGRTIERTEATSGNTQNNVAIDITLSSTLHLYDCSGGGKITGATSCGVNNKGEFYMHGGEISGNMSHGVDNRHAVFYMYGGKISGNISDGTGGIDNWFGTFYMYGGEISGNNAYMIGGVDNGNDSTFYMYGGKISGNIVKYPGIGGVENSGIFYMYGGEISDNIVGKNYNDGIGGVKNINVFYMYGGKISNNISGVGGVAGSITTNSSGETLKLGKMTVGGSAVISGNRTENGEERNICFYERYVKGGGKILIDSDNPLSGGARIGITMDGGLTEGTAIPLTDENDKDYSSYFYSDDENYAISDSVDHTVWLTASGEHTHVMESWSYDADNHWKQCLLCGEKSQEAAHTFGEWVTDTEATGTEDGQKHRDCSVCGFQETEIIPATRPTAPPTLSPTPAPTATPVPTPTATPVPTPTSVATEKPDATPKPVATKKPTEAPKPVVTEKPPATKQPSVTPKPSVTEKPSASPMPPATEQPSATPKPVDTKQPSATKQPIGTEKPTTTARPGEIRLKVEVRGNVPDTKVSTSIQDMADLILTVEDRKQMEDGQDISIYVVVTDISSGVSDADRELAEASSAGYVAGQYLDISLYKEVGSERTRITGPLAGNISFTLVVPDGLKNTDSTKIREFVVVRVHNGEAAMLPDKDSEAHTVTVDTDRFSTYEIVYKDMASGSNTGTSNGNGEAGGNQNDTGSPNGGSQTGVPGSADGTVNTGGRTVGNANVNVEKKESKDSRDKKSGGSGTGHAKDGEPKTGDVAPLELVATLAMISGLSYVLLYFLERRRGMTEETKKEIMAKLIAWAKKGGRLRKGMAIAAIFVFLVYYHSVGKETDVEWKQVYDE